MASGGTECTFQLIADRVNRMIRILSDLMDGFPAAMDSAIFASFSVSGMGFSCLSVNSSIVSGGPVVVAMTLQTPGP